MTVTDTRGLRAVVPLVIVSAVVVLVSVGGTHGLWLPNLHNALLALTFALVGAYVLVQRPGHREGRLFMAAGVAEGVLYLGRQIGHSPSSGSSRWWGWFGVWPLVVALALCTLAVICFPDGRLPSPRWRVVAALVVAITVVCASLSAVWPVDYRATGVVTAHPLNAVAPVGVVNLWTALAHPAYLGFQLLWMVAVVARWRSSDGAIRRQLTWVVGAAAISVSALLLGLAIWGTPVPGLLSAALLPLAAGWAIVHGQHVGAYSALTWLSRTGPGVEDLPTDLAVAVGQALAARGATLWMGPSQELQAVGVWPETGQDIAPTRLDALLASPDRHVRTVTSRGKAMGALSVDRASSDGLSFAESRLFDDLAAQAALVLDHLSLAQAVAGQAREGQVEGLSPREHEVLELMAKGLSNAAISEQLHLSIKTVEPIVSTIFTKLGLHPDAASNRRVLAVLTFVRT